MNTKHTPGPWKYDETWALIHAEHGSEIAAVHAARGTRGEAQANAHLIAAAPDLLAALEAFADNVSDDEDDYPDYEAYKQTKRLEKQAREAIAKATAQQ